MIGDTLWLSLTIPSQLKNISSGQVEDISGVSNMKTQINFDAISLKDPFAGSVDSFQYIPEKGSIETYSASPHSIRLITFNEANGSYNFSVGIVAKKKGVYALSAIDIYQAQKKCNYYSIEIKVTGDNHLYYLNSLYYPGSVWGDSIPAIEKTHTYCFKVY